MIDNNAPPTLQMRVALPESTDGEAIRRLAALGDRPPPVGPVMLAELSGRPIAAVGLAGGEAVLDPQLAGPGLIMQLFLRRLEARVIGSIWGA